MGFSAGFVVFLIFLFSILSTLLYHFLKKRAIATPFFKPTFIIIALVIGISLFAFVPINSDSKNNFFSLFGLVITAVLGISSTTFVSNAMAGFMLRNIKNFRPGDFIAVNDDFGRVSEMGLLHTEIQTKDRSLTTFPNMYLITHPVTVTPANGALVSARLSLGYDVAHTYVEELLIEAAKIIGLNDPFVQVTELGDFSISYRIAGFLPDAKHILTSQSNLRKQIITTLHNANVEIVSPTFMNQRQFNPATTFISDDNAQTDKTLRNKKDAKIAEERIFDKAENAENLNQLQQQLSKAKDEIAALNKDKPDGYTKNSEILEKQISYLTTQIESLKNNSKSS